MNRERERLSKAVMACSCVKGSLLHRRSGIRVGTALDTPIRARLLVRFFAKSLSLAAADCLTAVDDDWSPSTQIFTVS